MKNTKAKFNMKTRREIFHRDKGCVICGITHSIMDFHHCFFGLDTNYTNTRNNSSQGVLLCREHHSECHSCKSGEGIRQECINYLNNL